MITQEQFSEWKTNPVTKEIFSELQKVRDRMVEQLVMGNMIGESADQTSALTNRMIGHLEGIDQLLNISFYGESVVDEDVDAVSGY